MPKVLFRSLTDVSPRNPKMLYGIVVIFIVATYGSDGFRKVKREITLKKEFKASTESEFSKAKSINPELNFPAYKNANEERILNDFKIKTGSINYSPQFQPTLSIIVNILVY